jgi:hypothetical protein
MTVAHKPIPSQGDYENVLRRLEQLVSGSAADLRELSACEEKYVQMNMNVREWRFVRVKTHGKRVPLSVFLARVKGKVEPISISHSTSHLKRNMTVCFIAISSRYQIPTVNFGHQ